MESSGSGFEALRREFEAHGQGHVLRFWDRLDATQRSELVAQARRIAPGLADWVIGSRRAIDALAGSSAGALALARAIPLPEHGGDARRLERPAPGANNCCAPAGSRSSWSPGARAPGSASSGHLVAGRRLFDTPAEEKTVELFDGRDASGPFAAKTVTSSFFDCIVNKTNHFGYSWYIAPEAVVDDGYLDITLFEMKPLKYAVLLPLIYFGLYQRRLRHYKAKRVVITGRDMPLQFNGEVLGFRDRVEFRVLPNAIRMVVPPTRRAGESFQKTAA